MHISMWSFVRAHWSSVLQKLSLLYISSERNVRLIMLSCYLLFHIGSPCTVASLSPHTSISRSRHFTCISLTIWIPLHEEWYILKSSRSMISSFVSSRASLMADRACPLNPSPCGLYILIIVVSSPSNWNQSIATHGSNCWHLR